MAQRNKKKRNKAYTGADAATQGPTIHRYKAVQRSKLGQWWHEKKRMIKIVSIVALVIFIISWLIYELFRIIL